MARARKGISPVIATVIIVAVAIAISIAVAGWLMGLWGGFGQTESLKVFPDSYVDAQNDKLVLVIQNVGGSPAQIYKIEISGTELSLQNANVVEGADGIQVTDDGKIIIQPGAKGTIEITLGNFDAAAGVAYTVTIYTEAGNVYTTTVYGK